MQHRWYADNWGYQLRVSFKILILVCSVNRLNNTDPIAIHNSSYGRPNKAVHYREIMCTGAEDDLTQCVTIKLSLNVGKQFKTAAAAGVSCSSSGMPTTTQPPCIASPQTPATVTCTNGTTRLMGGQTTAEGRLEYCYNGQWSPFCTLRHQEAAVACKELGFTQYKCKMTVLQQDVHYCMY